MATFLGLTTVEGWGPPTLYPYIYTVKVIAVTTLLWCLRSPHRDLQARPRGVGLAIGVGLVIFGEWVWLHEWLQQWLPWSQLGERTAFNPFTQLHGWTRWLFLSCRLYGLILMVPIMEELFWRSFLLRYFSGPVFTRIPLGTFSWSAFAIVSVSFGLAHTEWLVATICGMTYALLLKATRSVCSCVIAHVTTNLALGVYILTTAAWTYW